MRALYFILGLAVATTIFTFRPDLNCRDIIPPSVAPLWRTEAPKSDLLLLHKQYGDCPVITTNRTHYAANKQLICKRT